MPGWVWVWPVHAGGQAWGAKLRAECEGSGAAAPFSAARDGRSRNRGLMRYFYSEARQL